MFVNYFMEWGTPVVYRQENLNYALITPRG